MDWIACGWSTRTNYSYYELWVVCCTRYVDILRIAKFTVSGKIVTSSNNHIGRCCWNVSVVQKIQKLDFFFKDDAITPPFHDGLLRL